MQPTLLIDADYFFYRAASAAEQELDYSEDLTVIVGSFKKGKRIVEQDLDNLKTRFDTDRLLLTFTDSRNFRKDVDPNYKGNRRKRKPAGYLKLKNWAIEAYDTFIFPGLEADDVMGIMATSGDYENPIIVSPDKDMRQIPCRIFDLTNEFEITEDQGLHQLFMQCLTGDQTDGYKGCPGIGPKKASELLKKSEYWWDVCVATYQDAGLKEEDALRNMHLARILQITDWDAENQEPLLVDPTVL